MIELTSEQEIAHQNATTCHICKGELDSSEKVHDHCHILGHYRGPAHSKCNLDYKISPKSWKLPCFFHNLRGYDGHLIVMALKERHGHIRLVPTNFEKYLSISVGQLHFLDSIQFTGGSSLENLVKTLTKDELHFTKDVFSNEEQFNLVTKKGIFPYDFFDSIEKLSYNKLPTKEDFFNVL